jgi:hypothetical protein
MMSLQAIQAESRKAARKAVKEHKLPFVFEQEDIDRIRATGDVYDVQIPFLGDYVPKGWRRTERKELFVDASGFGLPNEPAMTQDMFIEALTAGKGYAITEAGQFQVYVAEYEMKKGGRKE